MKIKLKESDVLKDWYLIVRQDHDNKTWFEKIGDCTFFMTSERLSPESCIEGTKEEMIEIAKAIKDRKDLDFHRVGVSFKDDGVHLFSPRNSLKDGVVSQEEADELAEQILKDLMAS